MLKSNLITFIVAVMLVGILIPHTTVTADGPSNVLQIVDDTDNLIQSTVFRDQAVLSSQSFSDWLIETVDNGDYASDVSLVLDMDGYPHISYYHYGDFDLKYAYEDASGWYTQTVDSDGSTGGSLALDDHGYPHISYWEGKANSDLKYAYQDASGWHIQIVDNADNTFGATNLMLDTDGYPHIVYYNGAESALKYAYQDTSGWQIHILDDTGNLAATSATLDDNHYLHASFYDVISTDLKYVYQDASGWHTQTVDSTGDVGRDASLSLNAQSYPHISYYDRTNGDLKYAYQDVSGWHVQVINSAGDVGLENSLALDGNGRPHISYWDDDSNNLKYAYRGTSGWHIQTIDSVYAAGWGKTSLKLDANGSPRIAYGCVASTDPFLSVLKYARGTENDQIYLPLVLNQYKAPNPESIPLLQTRWGQRNEYTRFSPDNLRLGCFSTAAAQILYYHRLRPSGYVSYQCSTGYQIDEDLSAYTFDWDVFVNEFTVGTPEASINEVAKYSYFSAVVVQKDFGTGRYVLGTSDRARSIATHYNCEVQVYTNSNYSMNQIKQTVIQEIDDGRPVLLYIRNLSQSVYHAVVIDAYRLEKNSFWVHINMGWEGYKNDWYDFDAPILDYDDNDYRKIITIKP